MFFMSMPKEISALRFTSFFSFMSIIYLTIVVIAEFFEMRSDYGEKVSDAPAARANAYSIFLVEPLVLFAYTCHPNVLPIYEELQDRSVKKMGSVLTIGLILVMLAYLLVGVFGFLTFYDDYGMFDFPGDFLTAKYHDGDILISIASWAILVTVLAGCPLLVHPCRDSTIRFLWKDNAISKLRYITVVATIVVLGLALALAIPNITIIFSLIGSLSSPFICYIIP